MLKSPLLEKSAVRHGFFTREGGVSTGLYSSLNCGPGSNDIPAAVAENRARAMALIGRNAEDLRTVYQVHSADVIVLQDRDDLVPRPKVDAMVTRLPGLALGILTADCVPILFADTQNGIIAAAHSGWKGAVADIGRAVVETMIGLGARRSSILAAIGPAISQESYEVGPEFPAPFLALDATSKKFFIPSVTLGHYMFDLKAFVRRRLEKLEIGGIDVLENDTCAEKDQFFSYRRMTKLGEADYGRQLSAITLGGE
ncbi:peptidoglycan editing factor PgeF [Sneathiella sp.]|uniref:peptidoglycan editing factor PgeF n=1 Tax=Sneathiella sp. TaxID=1964365 RepID=UPI0035690984